MGNTSSEVKRRYNEKTYKRWYADIKFEDYDRLEAAKGELSRAQFLLKLFEEYEKNHADDNK